MLDIEVAAYSAADQQKAVDKCKFEQSVLKRPAISEQMHKRHQ